MYSQTLLAVPLFVVYRPLAYLLYAIQGSFLDQKYPLLHLSMNWFLHRSASDSPDCPKYWPEPSTHNDCVNVSTRGATERYPHFNAVRRRSPWVIEILSTTQKFESISQTSPSWPRKKPIRRNVAARGHMA
ncbi:hypothetical protein BXZ70DRAFT_334535 [Cristinia sonorae]|uniref:Uncharacterized protein n=1 Tax=Cristinia sonorae TaxID=1940300 RepID=A0A8K0XNG2_9AGAR|nr:hypothetical protein BXZ70DRAFT_334535 [Cristinia sonorae]